MTRRRPRPAAAGRVEAGVDDLRFMADLLDDLQGRLCVDPARVAAGGFSAGGGVAARMGCDLAGRVASVAVVAGALYSEPGECRPSRAVPVLDMHGTGDVVVPDGGRISTVDWPLPMPPVPNWLADWAARDGCPGEPAVFLDTPGVSGFRWSGCRDGAEVVHYRINGGDHQAPAPSTASRSPRWCGSSSPPTRSLARRRGTAARPGPGGGRCRWGTGRAW